MKNIPHHVPIISLILLIVPYASAQDFTFPGAFTLNSCINTFPAPPGNNGFGVNAPSGDDSQESPSPSGRTLTIPQYNPNPKAMDGSLHDWGNGQLYQDPRIPSLKNKHLFANEAQEIYNTNYKYGMFPPGELLPDQLEAPLAQKWVVTPPMGSGFNIVSALISFDPTVKTQNGTGSYYIAFDLPGPTNDKLSDCSAFYNLWYFQNLGEYKWPVVFDVDCNEDFDIVDDKSITSPSSLNDHDDEYYKVFLWIGGNPDYVIPIEDEIYPDSGFEIDIVLRYDYLYNKYSLKASIPAKYIKDPMAIHYDSKNQKNPFDITDFIKCSFDPDKPSNQYDLEFEVQGVLDTLWDLIDPKAAKMTKKDIWHAWAMLTADSDSDDSPEERASVGIDTPFLPIDPDINMSVRCGYCNDSTAHPPSGEKSAYTLPGSQVKFYMDILLDQSFSIGYLKVQNSLSQLNDSTVDLIELADSIKICYDEIEYMIDGQPSNIKLFLDETKFKSGKPCTIMHETPWGDHDRLLFDTTLGDIKVIIPFTVDIPADFAQKRTVLGDFIDTIKCWSPYTYYIDGKKMTYKSSDSDSSSVDILVPELDNCTKLAQLTLAGGNKVPPVPSDHIYYEPADSDWPITVTWFLHLKNRGETTLISVPGDITDSNLCKIPGIQDAPFCDPGWDPPDLKPGESLDFQPYLVVHDYQEWTNICQLIGENYDFWNMFSVHCTVPETNHVPGAGDVFVCHTKGGEEVDAVHQECESNKCTISIPSIHIMVENFVGCEGENPVDDEATVLPGAELRFKLRITNTGSVDHQHTWFTDELEGTGCFYDNDFHITPGYEIVPKEFKKDGTKHEIVPPLKAGEYVEITFNVGTDPGYDQKGVIQEALNHLVGSADGPDEDIDPDVDDEDSAGIDIIVPELTCDKYLAVDTVDNDHYEGTDISFESTDGDYPVKAAYTLTISNTGESPIDDITVHDPVLCDIPDLANEKICQENNDLGSLQPGESIVIEVDWNVDNWYEFQEIAGNGDCLVNQFSASGIVPDSWQDDGLTIEPCITKGGTVVEAKTPHRDSNVVSLCIGPPPAQVKVEKSTGCSDNGPWSPDFTASVPGAYIYFKVEVTNPMKYHADDFVHLVDDLFGPAIECTWVEGSPGSEEFSVNHDIVIEHLGPGETWYVVCRCRVDPNYQGVNLPNEIVNHVLAEADGPDEGSEPDNGPDSKDDDEVQVDVLVPLWKLRKTTDGYDAGGWESPPQVKGFHLPDEITYPLTIHCDIHVENAGDVTFKDLNVEDSVWEQVPPEIDCVWDPPKPWKDDEFQPGESLDVHCTCTIDNEGELLLFLSFEDGITGTDPNTFMNKALASHEGGALPGGTCGEVGPGEKQDHVWIDWKVKTIPMLDETGLAVLAGLLALLILWKGARR